MESTRISWKFRICDFSIAKPWVFIMMKSRRMGIGIAIHAGILLLSCCKGAFRMVTSWYKNTFCVRGVRRSPVYLLTKDTRSVNISLVVTLNTRLKISWYDLPLILDALAPIWRHCTNVIQMSCSPLWYFLFVRWVGGGGGIYIVYI